VKRGHTLLPKELQVKFCNNSCREARLYQDEKESLQSFLRDLGLLYHKFYVKDIGYMKDPTTSFLVTYNNDKQATNGSAFFWTRSLDNCYENLKTGELNLLHTFLCTK